MAKYVIKELANGRFNFTLEDEGDIIMTSEPYFSIDRCRAAIGLARVSCKDYSGYIRNLSHSLKFYFVLRAANYELIGSSGLFDTTAGMRKCIDRVREAGQTTWVEDPAFQI